LPLDPSHPRERLAWMLADSGARVLLVEERLAGLLPAGAAETLYLEELAAGGGEENARPPAPGGGAARPAHVIYTSGSTGRPKGVMTSHRAIVSALRSSGRSLAIAPSDRVLLNIPISFDPSLWEIFWPFTAGAALVVAQPGGHQDRDYLLD